MRCGVGCGCAEGAIITQRTLTSEVTLTTVSCAMEMYTRGVGVWNDVARRQLIIRPANPELGVELLIVGLRNL